MNARLSFAVFLETAGPGEAATRMQQQFGDAAVEDSRARWSGKILGPQTTLEEVEAALGPPDVRDDFKLSYLLPTREGYVYTFEFDPSTRRLLESGFQRIEAGGENSERTEEQEKPVRLGATASEIRSILGLPKTTYGWWPWESWEYPEGLTLHLRHGVVEDIEGSHEGASEG
jgi:hypothetical protein